MLEADGETRMEQEETPTPLTSLISTIIDTIRSQIYFPRVLCSLSGTACTRTADKLSFDTF